MTNEAPFSTLNPLGIEVFPSELMIVFHVETVTLPVGLLGMTLSPIKVLSANTCRSYSMSYRILPSLIDIIFLKGIKKQESLTVQSCHWSQ